MREATDLGISAGVRRELSGRRIDLSKLKFPVKAGVVTLQGEFCFVDAEKTTDETAIELKFIESSLRSLPGVKDVLVDLTNWTRSETGAWEPVGGSTSRSDSLAPSIKGDGITCTGCDYVIRFCPCCGKPLSETGSASHSRRQATAGKPVIGARKHTVPPIKPRPVIAKPAVKPVTPEPAQVTPPPSPAVVKPVMPAFSTTDQTAAQPAATAPLSPEPKPETPVVPAPSEPVVPTPPAEVPPAAPVNPSPAQPEVPAPQPAVPTIPNPEVPAREPAAPQPEIPAPEPVTPAHPQPEVPEEPSVPEAPMPHPPTELPPAPPEIPADPTAEFDLSSLELPVTTQPQPNAAEQTPEAPQLTNTPTQQTIAAPPPSAQAAPVQGRDQSLPDINFDDLLGESQHKPQSPASSSPQPEPSSFDLGSLDGLGDDTAQTQQQQPAPAELPPLASVDAHEQLPQSVPELDLADFTQDTPLPPTTAQPTSPAPDFPDFDDDIPLPPMKPRPAEASTPVFPDLSDDDTPLPPMKPSAPEPAAKSAAKAASNDPFAALFSDSDLPAAPKSTAESKDPFASLDLDVLEIFPTEPDSALSPSAPTANAKPQAPVDDNPFNFDNVIDLDLPIEDEKPKKKPAKDPFNLDDFDLSKF